MDKEIRHRNHCTIRAPCCDCNPQAQVRKILTRELCVIFVSALYVAQTACIIAAGRPSQTFLELFLCSHGRRYFDRRISSRYYTR